MIGQKAQLLEYKEGLVVEELGCQVVSMSEGSEVGLV